MILTLSITDQPQGVTPREPELIVDRHRAVIGRSAESDWTLADPDKELSRKHCIIEFRAGAYHVIDISANGIFLNGSDERLGRGNARELNNGDVIGLGHYRISVKLAEADEIDSATAIMPAEAALQAGTGEWRAADEPTTRAPILSPEALAAERERLAQNNASPTVVPTDQARRDLDDLLGTPPSAPPPANSSPAPHAASSAQGAHQSSRDLDDLLGGTPPPPPPVSPSTPPDNLGSSRQLDALSEPGTGDDLDHLFQSDERSWQHGKDAPAAGPDMSVDHLLSDFLGDAEPSSNGDIDSDHVSALDAFVTPPVASPPSGTDTAQNRPPPPPPPSAPHLDVEATAVIPPSALPTAFDAEATAVMPNPPSVPPAAVASPPVTAPPQPPAPVRPTVAPPPPPPVSAQPAPVPPTGTSDSVLIDAFLRGAGMPELANEFRQNPEQLMETVGAMFYQSMRGAMDILMARGNFKSMIGVDKTMMQPMSNNPLKLFPPSAVREALKVLLSSHPNPAYLQPADAVREGFDDIRIHHLAVMAGTQAALNELLATFSPQHLESLFSQERSMLDGVLPGHRKARYWNQYSKHYARMSEQVKEDFSKTLQSFAQKYEEQEHRRQQ